jgi:ATP-dependent 26S proteasome regulatory subunit
LAPADAHSGVYASITAYTRLSYTCRHTTALPHTFIMSGSTDPEREHALEQYKGKLLESREWEAKLKALRLDIKGLQHDFDVSEDNIKALQSVGQIIGEVLKQLDEERCGLRQTCSIPNHTDMF